MDAREDAPAAPGDGADAPSTLLADVEDLIGDAQTWFDAELGYQKVRAAFVGANLKQALALGIAAVLLLVVAVMGLTFGLVLALTPLVSAWGATAIVVGLLLLGALLSTLGARKAWGALMGAIREDGEES